jgi:FlaG/FlaF family flagellin (archaellin)
VAISRVLKGLGIVVILYAACSVVILPFKRPRPSLPTVVVNVNNTTSTSRVFQISVSGMEFNVVAPAQSSVRESLRVADDASQVRVSSRGDVLLESEYELDRDSIFISESSRGTRAVVEGRR